MSDQEVIDKSIFNYPTLQKCDDEVHIHQRLLNSFLEASKSKDFLIATIVAIAWQKNQLNENNPATLSDLQQYLETNKINIAIEPTLKTELRALSVDQKQFVTYGAVFHVGIKSYVDDAVNKIFTKMTKTEYYQRLRDTGYWFDGNDPNSTNFFSLPSVTKLINGYGLVLKDIPSLSEYLSTKLSKYPNAKQMMYGMNQKGGPIMIFVDSVTNEIICPVILSSHYGQTLKLIISFDILSNSNLDYDL